MNCAIFFNKKGKNSPERYCVEQSSTANSCRFPEAVKQVKGGTTGTLRADCELSEGESRKWTGTGQPATSAVCTRVWHMFLLALDWVGKTCGWLNGACERDCVE